MFTGLVEGLRTVVAATPTDEGLKLVIDLAESADAGVLGASIAVNGCCLTVDGLEGRNASFHAGRETLSLTTLGNLAEGDQVNVERALRMGDSLGGHMVTGHVDGIGEVVAISPEESQTVITFRLPERLHDQVILKGSIAIDGVSLTLTEVKDGCVSVALIPHTLSITTMGLRGVGEPVNIETDMIGKWVVQQITPILDELRGS